MAAFTISLSSSWRAYITINPCLSKRLDITLNFNNRGLINTLNIVLKSAKILLVKDTTFFHVTALTSFSPKATIFSLWCTEMHLCFCMGTSICTYLS